MSIKLWQGDCLELMKDIPDGSIALILCDLPYGTTASDWDQQIPMNKLWEHYNRILTATGTVLLFANGIFTPRVMMSNLEAYKYRLVWVKNNSTNFVHAKNRPLVKSEDILVFSRGSMGHKNLLGDTRMTYNPQGLIKIDKKMSGGKGNFTDTLAGKRPSHVDDYVREYTNYPTDVITDYPEVSTHQKYILMRNQFPY